jgi:hypothetical protein
MLIQLRLSSARPAGATAELTSEAKDAAAVVSGDLGAADGLNAAGTTWYRLGMVETVLIW